MRLPVSMGIQIGSCKSACDEMSISQDEFLPLEDDHMGAM